MTTFEIPIPQKFTHQDERLPAEGGVSVLILILGERDLLRGLIDPILQIFVPGIDVDGVELSIGGGRLLDGGMVIVNVHRLDGLNGEEGSASVLAHSPLRSRIGGPVAVRFRACYGARVLTVGADQDPALPAQQVATEQASVQPLFVRQFTFIACGGIRYETRHCSDAHHSPVRLRWYGHKMGMRFIALH